MMTCHTASQFGSNKHASLLGLTLEQLESIVALNGSKMDCKYSIDRISVALFTMITGMAALGLLSMFAGDFIKANEVTIPLPPPDGLGSDIRIAMPAA